jgi:hypothetical protein
MSEQLQQFIIVAAFGGLCFGCGLPHRVYSGTQQMARRNDKAWSCPLQLAYRQMGLGRDAERGAVGKLNASWSASTCRGDGWAKMTQPSRRFPPPWSIEDNGAAFRRC